MYDHLSDFAAEMLEKPDHIVTPKGLRVVRFLNDGRPIYFVVKNENDTIQRRIMRRGNFYEAKYLRRLHGFFPAGGTFCDIGANVGNHSIYALKRFRAKKTIVFEPNPNAYEMLILNLILNDCLRFADVSNLGFGVSNKIDDGYEISVPEMNLGAGSLTRGDGSLKVFPADTLLKGEKVDFIKIDVEGMELEALGGLRQTVSQFRPPIFVEVLPENRDGLEEWVKEADYWIPEDKYGFQDQNNYLILPNEIAD